MHALILGCLLCLQISAPCGFNQNQPIAHDPSCYKCIADLNDYLKSPMNDIVLDNSTSPVLIPSKPVHTEPSSEANKVLQSLLADTQAIAQNMNQNPNEVYDLINKIGTEIRQGLQPEVQGTKASHQVNEGTIQKIQKQEHLLEKITSKFQSLHHHSEEILSKLSSMKNLLSDEGTKAEGNEQEGKIRRDSVMQGEKLMAGEYLASKNGEFKLLLSAETGEWIMYDRQGTVLKRQLTCSYPKPTPPQLHLKMNEGLEFYLEIWNGKSANLQCLSGVPVGCIEKDSKCFVKLDNDGYLKMCKPSGEPVQTLF